MKDTNEHSFEEEFRKAFENAEINPEPALWANIDSHLANQEAAKYKRKLYIFKLRVAAAAALLIGILGAWFTFTYTSNTNPIAGQNVTPAQQNVTQGQSTVTTVKPEHHIADLGNENKNTNAPVATLTPKGKDKETITEPVNPVEEQENILAVIPERIVKEKKNKNPLSKKEGTATEEKINEQSNIDLADSFRPNLRLGNKNNAARNSISSHATVKLSPPAFALTPATSQLEKEEPNGSYQQEDMNGQRQAMNYLSSRIKIPKEPFALEPVPVKWQVPLNQWEETDEKEEKKSRADKWSVGLAFAPNQFDPNLQPTSAPTASNAAYRSFAPATMFGNGGVRQSIGQELSDAQPAGLSYNVGVSLGYALSNRITFQSGVQYLYNNSQIITNNYVEDFTNKERYPAFVSVLDFNSSSPMFSSNQNADKSESFVDSHLPDISENALSNNVYPGTTEVTVYNTYEYMSIPFKISYKVLDKKLSTSLGAGVAADIFLRNSIGNESVSVNKTVINNPVNSIYKGVGFSGLVSARLHYRLSSRYGFYLEPSYRRAITSFSKIPYLKSMPQAFGIGTGFQYHF